ncbi:MAG: VWA domain-containing protein [Gordonia sp.]|uniref:VWA domain-containing protein n=1 Tax=Gordonia sp. (in: high G+C Gram-positive bacteria) TaxID=84139 RepID=UPI001D908B95|nr:VWA domain-containing protein [Gordonia sp. (in: high G+C Gram-positive bacteria)]MCB1293571.1 VWA domain-containing protein [Gordonia sp. (in: high G+C Gram-positive bacteria)]HQV19566.1 VWA domain-containing protein [Gordonia sp. (in: high G+C Gram-positive bacteria)]
MGFSDDEFGFAGDGRRRRRRILQVVLAVVLVIVAVAGVILWRGNADGCGDRTSVRVAADPTVVATVRSLTAIAADTGCFDYDVDEVAGADVPGRLTSGDDKSPELWVADSQTQARRVITQVRKSPDYVTESLASSPTVVAGTGLGSLKTWIDVMKLPDLRIGSPMETSTGDAPIIAALAEVKAGRAKQDELTQALSILAIQQNNARPANDSEATRLNLANVEGIPVITTEQQFSQFQRRHPESKLKSAIPADGTVMLDYPLLNTAGRGSKDDAAAAGKELVAAASSVDGRKVLHNSSFRDPGGSGFGAKVTVLDGGDAALVDKTLRQWQVLGIPIRTIFMIDTSGSMRAPAGDSTRAKLLIGAATQGLGLFPNNTQGGLWIFGINKGGAGQDWKELLPVRRLDAASSRGTHRDDFAAEITRAMTDDLGGGTGLYDSILAAYKQAQAGYDPTYSNSVIVMTDGRNEDANSIGLDELLTTLEQLADPARPVLVLTIGISGDADADALSKISEATGGSSYIAETAADIESVFVNAIAARVKAAGQG